MSMIENMAQTMRLYMEQRNKSTAAFSDELEIARSTLRQYIEGTGNPSLSTVEHIAQKLDVDPVMLICGNWEPQGTSTAVRVLQTTMAVAELSAEDRQCLFDCFEKVVSFLEKTI